MDVLLYQHGQILNFDKSLSCGLLSFTIGLGLDNPLSVFLVVLIMEGFVIVDG